MEILTFNNEKTIRRTLESVRDFDEIIIIDGGSTDGTLEIVKEYKCKIIFQDAKFKNIDNTISDFAGVRNQGLAVAAYDWFLYIDSDEYLSVKISKEIEEIIASRGKIFIFNMPRKYVINGRVINCTTTYPNYQTRFFNKNAVEGFIKKIHERIKIKKDYKKAKLINCQYVPIENAKALIVKWNKYLQLEVERNKNQSFLHWIRFMLFQNVKVSMLYLLRYIKIILFCKGDKMPLSYEMLRHWYHFKLIWLTFKKFINLK